MAERPIERATAISAAELDPLPETNSTAQGSDQARIMAALAVAAQPRPGDTPESTALRRILADADYMAHVLAVVEQWPQLTTDQQEALTPILNPQRAAPPTRR